MPAPQYQLTLPLPELAPPPELISPDLLGANRGVDQRKALNLLAQIQRIHKCHAFQVQICERDDVSADVREQTR